MTSRSLRLAVLVATLLTTTTYTGLAADADSTTASTATTAAVTTTATDSDSIDTVTTATTSTVQTKALTEADKEKAQLVETMNEKAAANAAAEEAKGFKDVKNHWAAVPINVMLEDGILSGNGQGEFKPDDALKTADAAALYNKLIAYDKAQQAAKAAKSSQNKKNTKNTTTVKDVTGEELLAPFKNQETLTREEFAQTAAEYLAYKDELTVASIKSKTKAKEYKPNIVVAPDEVNFPDEKKIDSDYKSSVTTLASRGIIASGGDDNYFRPTEDITRAEAVAMLFRIEKGMTVSPATSTKAIDTNAKTVSSATGDKTATTTKNTTTGNVTAKKTSELEAQSDLENKVFKKLNNLYKTPGNFQNYGVMYWQNDVLHVAFKSDDDLAQFEDILAKNDKDKLASETLANRVHLETTQYSQAEYDRIENNFRTFYAQKQPAGTILGAYPSVAHNQLIVRVDKGFDYMNDSIRNAFGNKVHVFLVTDNADSTTDTAKN
ncbi:MAG: S-layer homology domain-containing protein [Veillonella sp.]|uniref:S-layer homology domain-containing protein n=1 Tax=Veillonella sp. TaxID=1926307 RepID=UPI0025FC72E2|nr:S-layer homology domain-containing protein [Veillonella sp.]MBE6080146.1 S-layer homology domain-containing protein [Veillonella sp.]